MEKRAFVPTPFAPWLSEVFRPASVLTKRPYEGEGVEVIDAVVLADGTTLADCDRDTLADALADGETDTD